MAAKTDIWMPLYIGDYLADTSHLEAQQHGCYLLWLMHYWRKGPLPNDLHVLALVGKLRGVDAPSIAQALLDEFFTLEEDGKWHQKRTDSEITLWRDKSIKAKEKATRAARGRWSQDAPSNAPSNASSNAQAMLEPCPSPSPSPKRLKKPSRGKREVHPLFAPLKEMVFKYYRGKNGDVDPPWDGMEAKQLSSLLASSPKAPLEHWHACLANRYKSDVSHGDRPGLWLPKLSSYRAGPLNGFNRPKETNIPAGRKYMTTSPFPGAELQ